MSAPLWAQVCAGLVLALVAVLWTRHARQTWARRIPPHVLRRYHQSGRWAPRRQAFLRHHPRVCYACLWLLPVAFLGWLLVQLSPGRRLKGVWRRVFRRLGIEVHHATYKSIWDGKELHPGCEKDRELYPLCTRFPVLSRFARGLDHHAGADRVRRACERLGLPPVAACRLYILKCWVVQSTVLTSLAGTAVVVLRQF